MTDTPDRLLIPILSASNFVIGMGAFLVIGLINPMSQDLGISTAQTGWVLTSYALAYGVLSPVLVSATGRIGRRRILAAGLGIFAIASVLSAISPSEPVLFASRIIAAAGAGMFTPVAASVAAGLSAPERRARALAAVFFGLTLAQVFGVPAGSFIAYTFGWRLAFVVVALLALPCLWLIWSRVPAGLSFQAVTLKDLSKTLQNGRVMLAVLFTTTFLSAIYVVFTYLSPLLAETMGFGRNGISIALVVSGFGAVAGNILGGMVADRIGPVRTLISLSILQTLSLPLFSTLPYPEITVLVLIFCWSTFGWSFMAAQQVRLISMAPETASVVLALNAAAIYIGAALGSAIGGVVLGSHGLHALGIAGGLMAIVAIAHILLSARLDQSIDPGQRPAPPP